MKVLSLFDGMACGMLAMQKAGLEVERYVAYEIDKYAVQTSTHNFPMIEHRGDVFQADFSEFFDFDFLIGGSPCTYWSIAQKNNRETEASGMGWELFSQYVRALHEAKPKFFIYENNESMSKVIRASIDEAFGFEAVFINSALLSAQNRQRLYWVGKRNDDGTYSKVNVEQPQDSGIMLKHILERGYDLTGNEKSYCLTASYDGACAWNTIERSQRSMVAEPVAINTTADGDKARTLMAGYYKYGTATLLTNPGFTGGTTAVAEPCVGTICVNSKSGRGGVEGLQPSLQDRIYDINGKHTAVTTAFMPSIAVPVCVAECGRYTEDGSIEQRFEAREDGKTNVLTTVQKDNNVAEPLLWATPVELDGGGKPIKAISRSYGKTYDVYQVKDGKITIKGKQYPIKLADGYYIIRKLTVRESMRLQTVPEWYEFPVSDSQAYKMLGNGWTVDVIVHLITSAIKEV